MVSALNSSVATARVNIDSARWPSPASSSENAFVANRTFLAASDPRGVLNSICSPNFAPRTGQFSNSSAPASFGCFPQPFDNFSRIDGATLDQIHHRQDHRNLSSKSANLRSECFALPHMRQGKLPRRPPADPEVSSVPLKHISEPG